MPIRLTHFFVLLITFGFSLSLQAKDKRLNITGSSTVAPLILEIAKRYEKENEGVRIDVQTGGSSRGILDARRGLADIGMVSRAQKSNEGDLKFHTVAKDGIAIIVHADNPIESLSDEQVVDIYQNKIDNWSKVGGSDKDITVVNKAEGRSTLEVFLKYFGLKNSTIKADIIIGDNQQGIKTVVGNVNSIGYVSIGAAEFEEGQGAKIKRLAVAGIPATTEAVEDGSFPISRPLNLVTLGELSPIADDFIKFAQSPEVLDLIEGQFLVPAKK